MKNYSLMEQCYGWVITFVVAIAPLVLWFFYLRTSERWCNPRMEEFAWFIFPWVFCFAITLSSLRALWIFCYIRDPGVILESLHWDWSFFNLSDFKADCLLLGSDHQVKLGDHTPGFWDTLASLLFTRAKCAVKSKSDIVLNKSNKSKSSTTDVKPSLSQGAVVNNPLMESTPPKKVFVPAPAPTVSPVQPPAPQFNLPQNPPYLEERDRGFGEGSV